MAAHVSTRNASTDNRLTRRAPLAGTAAVGALALPAGAAVAAVPGDVASPSRSGTDPHIAWWREWRAARAAAEAAIDEPNEDDLWDVVCDLECRIARTIPSSPEGAAIVATLLTEWCDEERRDGAVIEVAGGAGVARYILAHTPAAVLRRAGLEDVA